MEKIEKTKIVKELTDKEKLYLNRLTTNLNQMDKELKKRLKKSIINAIEQIFEASKGKKYFNIAVTDNVRQSLEYDLKQALNLKDDIAISNRMLEKAVISATKNKFIRSDVKNVKVEGFAYSISDFLKSLNASIYGKIERALTK